MSRYTVHRGEYLREPIGSTWRAYFVLVDHELQRAAPFSSSSYADVTATVASEIVDRLDLRWFPLSDFRLLYDDPRPRKDVL